MMQLLRRWGTLWPVSEDWQLLVKRSSSFIWSNGEYYQILSLEQSIPSRSETIELYVHISEITRHHAHRFWIVVSMERTNEKINRQDGIEAQYSCGNCLLHGS